MSRKSKDTSIIRSSAAEYLTYVAATGSSDESIELRYEDENIWLTQKMMATLYGVEVPTINEHIKKIYEDSELSPDATIRKFRIVHTECKYLYLDPERKQREKVNVYFSCSQSGCVPRFC